MVRDNDDHSSNGNKPPGNKERQEPTFSHYDEDEEYEEPDRDADHTAGYRVDDAAHEDDFDENYPEDNEPDLFQDDVADTEYDAGLADEREPDAWPEKEDYFEEDEDHQQNWPLSLIAVAIVALILLAAGGYGVMQQRTATENELRELRAALATSANPSDVSDSRNALEEQQQAVDKLATETEALRLENRALSDTIAGLQAQLSKLQTVSTQKEPVADQAAPTTKDSVTTTKVKPEPVKAVATPSTTPEPKAPKPQRAKPAVSTPTGRWFVNFGSYATRDMAASWAGRLKPGAGKVAIIPSSSSGRTLYRLRVIGLADGESAKQVARKLETDLQVSELWVGKE